MSKYSFSELSRQSPKGIVINYFMLLYKLVKSFWVLIPIFFAGKSMYNKWIIIGLVGIAAILLLVAILQYLNFKFKIEGGNFILKRGVFFKTNSSIPLDRIQSVNFKQNLIHQIINVTQVEIQTAGAKEVEVSIKAISRSKAEALKRKLQEVSYVGQIEEEENESVRSNSLFKLSFLDLLKVSFSENHVRSFFWIIAIIISLYYQVDDFIKDSDLFTDLVQYYYNNQEVFDGSVYLLLLVLSVVIVVSVIVSFVRVILRHFNQQVDLINEGIQISQGLFTKRDDVLKVKKIQYTVTVTNPFKKLLGIQTIRIRQAGSAKVKQKKMIELVGVKDKYLKLLDELFFNYSGSENSKSIKPSSYYLFRLSVRAVLLTIAINVFLFLNFSLINHLAINCLLIPFMIVYVRLKYKKAYFNFKDKKMVVGSGSIATVTTLMEYYKTQNLTWVQSFIQKRRGVVSLHLQTASGVIKLPCLKEEDAEFIMDTIITEASNSSKNWI